MSQPLPKTPSIATLRRLLDELLVDDVDMDAFCLDYFFAVKKQFSSGMQRRAKVTLLLEIGGPAEVYTALHKAFPEQHERLQSVVAKEQLAPVLLGGDYRLVRLIGRGSMGAVYEAEQGSTGQRRAIKRMHSQFLHDAEHRQRFAREARISAQIASEHVVQVLATGVDEEAKPWLAMELLEGEDLQAYMSSRGRLSLEEVDDILAQLCHALSAAHQKSIVHRDVKPSNIFISRSLRVGTSQRLVKVLDFGLAKLVAESQVGSTSVLGTPLWMAPEQTTPFQVISPATDVWALGLLVFYMLCGRHYFLVAEQPNIALAAIMRELVLEPLVPASERAATYGCAELPPNFDTWFGYCVAREPSSRFQEAYSVYAGFVDIVLHGNTPSDAAAAAVASLRTGAAPREDSARPPLPDAGPAALATEAPAAAARPNAASGMHVAPSAASHGGASDAAAQPTSTRPAATSTAWQPGPTAVASSGTIPGEPGASAEPPAAPRPPPRLWSWHYVTTVPALVLLIAYGNYVGTQPDSRSAVRTAEQTSDLARPAWLRPPAPSGRSPGTAAATARAPAAAQTSAAERPTLDASAATGHLDRSVIAGVLKRNSGALNKCIQQAHAHDPSRSGDVLLEFIIGADGNVTSQAVRPLADNSPQAESCLDNVLRQMVFPKPAGGAVHVSQRLSLHLTDQD